MTALPLHAHVTVTDRTNTSVQVGSLEEVLNVIRQRAGGDAAVVCLAPVPDVLFEDTKWRVTPVAVEAADPHAEADYYLEYTDWSLTDLSGQARPVSLASVPGIAQTMADSAAAPVTLHSALYGFKPMTFTPQSGPATNGTHHAPIGLPEQPAQFVSPAPSFAEEFASRRTNRRALAGPAEESWQGAFNRLLRLGLKPGRHERALRQLRAGVQQGLAGARTVMFCNVKGGATKTTSTYGVAATIGRVRGGNILAWDNNENSGDLVDRGIRAPHGRTAIDLYESLEHITSLAQIDQLAHYMHPQGDNRFDVLASQNVAGTRQVIDAAAFGEMHTILRAFYSITLVDTGNASTATTWQAAAEAADVVLIAMENAENSARKAAQTLDAIRAHAGDQKVANAVALITQPSSPSKERSRQLHSLLQPQLRQVLEVPYDNALKEGEEIVWESLQARTREAYLHAAAAIVEGL